MIYVEIAYYTLFMFMPTVWVAILCIVTHLGRIWHFLKTDQFVLHFWCFVLYLFICTY